MMRPSAEASADQRLPAAADVLFLVPYLLGVVAITMHLPTYSCVFVVGCSPAAKCHAGRSAGLCRQALCCLGGTVFAGRPRGQPYFGEYRVTGSAGHAAVQADRQCRTCGVLTDKLRESA